MISFKGLNYGIDFKGGTLIELRNQDPGIEISQIRSAFMKAYDNPVTHDWIMTLVHYELVKNGSIEISEANQLDCIFILKEGENELAVNYNKTRPDLFKDGAEVIVTGEYLNGVFYADELQTKCASRYEGDLRDESNYNLEEIDT